MELSWAQRDAMQRNIAVAALNSSLAHATALLEGVARVVGLDAEARAVLDPDQVGPYNQRVSLLLYKLQASLTALGRMDYPQAAGYALSGAHDTAALHMLLRSAKHDYSRELHCIGAQRHARWWWLPGCAALVCFAMITWRVLSDGPGSSRDKSHLF